MKLADWIEAQKITAHTFAARIGRAPSTITRLISGRHTPDAATMKAIIEVTAGEVMPNDFFDLPSDPPPVVQESAA